MHALILMTVLAQWAPREAPHYGHTRESRRMGNRSLVGQGYAFFEFAPASGAGMPSACSTTAPTGARGEQLIFTRTGNATCSKKGLATTGIADGDLVVMSGNVARVEPDADGVLGLRVEGSRANVLVRSDDLGNAAYADVGTPVLTGSQTDPFATTTATTVEDNDAAAYEGRSQSVTVSAGAAYILSCYLKAGTLTTARLSLDGTACNVSGLSASTWTRATCADASSSGVSIAVQLLVGNATTDTGTVTWGGCQVEAGAYASSYIPTVAAAVTRNADVPSFALSAPGATTLCMSTTYSGSAGGGSVFRNFLRYRAAANDSFALVDTNVGEDLFAEVNETQTRLVGASPFGTSKRLKGYVTGATLGACVDSTCQTVAQTQQLSNTAKTLYVGTNNSGTNPGDGLFSRIIIDPVPTRCDP